MPYIVQRVLRMVYSISEMTHQRREPYLFYFLIIHFVPKSGSTALAKHQVKLAKIGFVGEVCDVRVVAPDDNEIYAVHRSRRPTGI